MGSNVLATHYKIVILCVASLLSLGCSSTNIVGKRSVSVGSPLPEALPVITPYLLESEFSQGSSVKKLLLDHDKELTIEDMKSVSITEYIKNKDKLYLTSLKDSLLFDIDNYDGGRIENKVIEQVANAYLNKKLGQYLFVVGNTDSDGALAYNHALSVKRAMTVVQELVKDGVEINNIRIVPAGEIIPVVANDSRANKARNRRVEILSSDNQDMILSFFKLRPCEFKACVKSSLPIYNVSKQGGVIQIAKDLELSRTVKTMEKIKVKESMSIELKIKPFFTIAKKVRKKL
jgi:outer membrane protein OmpA-like peptidoglycan-associated protein